MPDDNSNSTQYSDLVSGTPTEEEENTDEQQNSDQTAENVSENDPEKNKKLAEITMSEQLRETYQLTLNIPRIFEGIHTNQWFHMEVNEDFYETNYPVIAKLIGDEKFGRFAGFRKGRFFIDKIVEKGGIDGFSMEITLNPIAPSLATYTKMQEEAKKALIEAVKDEQALTGGGGNQTGTGAEVAASDLIAIGNELAAKYTYSSACQSYSCMKEKGSGSCWAWSGALYVELTAKGYQCRVIQYDSGVTSNHRSVQYMNNGQWVDYPYRQTNIDSMLNDTKSKGGMFEVTGETLRNSF